MPLLAGLGRRAAPPVYTSGSAQEAYQQYPWAGYCPNPQCKRIILLKCYYSGSTAPVHALCRDTGGDGEVISSHRPSIAPSPGFQSKLI